MMGRVPALLEMIKWKHTVFALPIALAAVALAAESAPPHGLGWWLGRIGLVMTACFVARTAAMTHNRFVDRDIDATNARTASRPSVTGEVSVPLMIAVVILCCAAFIGIAALLNRMALTLSVPFLVVLLGYSHAKRFTALAHVWLGVALGLAPLGAWVAIHGTLAWPPVLLGLAVVPWVTGFDILYALADIGHDRREGLHSIPARLGLARSLDVAAFLHAIAFGLFIALAFAVGLGAPYAVALAFAGSILLYEHHLVRPGDLGALPAAFQTYNGLFSIVIMCGIVLDGWVG